MGGKSYTGVGGKDAGNAQKPSRFELEVVLAGALMCASLFQGIYGAIVVAIGLLK